MGKAKDRGVKGLSIQGLDGVPDIVGHRIDLGCKCRAVNSVADQGMADMGHVHADLMGAAGFELAFGLGDGPFLVIEAAFDAKMGDGLAAVARQDRLPETVVRVAPNHGFDSADQRVGDAPHKGGIGTLERTGSTMIGELGGEPVVVRDAPPCRQACR